MEQNYHQSNLGFIYFFNFWTCYLSNLAHKGGLVDQILVFLNKTKSYKFIQYTEYFDAYNKTRQQLNSNVLIDGWVLTLEDSIKSHLLAHFKYLLSLFLSLNLNFWSKFVWSIWQPQFWILLRHKHHKNASDSSSN